MVGGANLALHCRFVVRHRRGVSTLATSEQLQLFFEEHASQAMKHEEQREKATNLVLTIAAAMTGLVTYSKLSIFSLPASLAIVFVGGIGYFFSGKHYERARMHTEVLRQIRLEMDKDQSDRTLSQLTRTGRDHHYLNFRWPLFKADEASQIAAPAWIARQRLNAFWDALHLFVVLIGIGLTSAILVAHFVLPKSEEVQAVRVINAGDLVPSPTGASSASK